MRTLKRVAVFLVGFAIGWFGADLAIGASALTEINNPGNIKCTQLQWRGKIGCEGEYVVFDTAQNGIRAMSKNLDSYYHKHGLWTIREIMARWAEAPHAAATLAGIINYGIDDPILVWDTRFKMRLIKGIIQLENGYQPYDDVLILEAIK